MNTKSPPIFEEHESKLIDRTVMTSSKRFQNPLLSSPPASTHTKSSHNLQNIDDAIDDDYDEEDDET